MLRLAIALIVVAAGAAIVQFAASSAPPVSSSADCTGTPLYELSAAQLDQHLRFLASAEPDPAVRLCRLAEQNRRQPYQGHALGGGPYDAADPRPLYALRYGDTASFVEQLLAMSVTSDFESFFLVLQRLRYRDGQVSTATRNHNLLADWPGNNAWLLDDITERLAGGTAWIPVHQVVRRQAFLRERYGITAEMPDEKFVGSCIPRVYLYKVLPELRAGDVVLFITGNSTEQFCTEMGIVLMEPSDTQRPLRLIQSRPSGVEKTIFRKTVWLRKEIMGFKFLRLRADAAEAAAGAAAEMRGRLSIP